MVSFKGLRAKIEASVQKTKELLATKALQTKIETLIQHTKEAGAIKTWWAKKEAFIQNAQKLHILKVLRTGIETFIQTVKGLPVAKVLRTTREALIRKVKESRVIQALRTRIEALIEKIKELPALKALQAKVDAFIQNIKELVSRYRYAAKHFFAPTVLILRKIYAPTIRVVSKVCETLALIISTAATFIHLIASKIDKLLKYIRRKLYVRKILSARNQWYINKKGNFYNPKLKVTIYPSWECTWNIAQSSDIYQGYESKKQAQEVAFKMWMKMRLLKKRLDTHYMDVKIPINLTQKILSNKIQLRKPTLRDIDQLLALMEQPGCPEANESIKTRIQTYATQSTYQVLLAEKGKKVVGFIAFVLYDLFMSEGKRCRIEGLVVDAKDQDLSVKRKLIQAVEDFARDNKGKVVDLTDDLHPATDGMRDLYKFLGYSHESTVAKAYLKKEL